jgi:hypothetical protein
MKHIWIIHNTSATNLFYRNYSELKIDPDLLSGLLSALDNFSEVELKSNQGISSIEMGGLRWVYLHQYEVNLMFIGAANKDAHANIMKSQLEVIYKQFQQKYNITSEKMDNTLINVNEFLDFDEDLDMLISQWKMAEQLLAGGAIEIFDILGIFQHTFNLHLEIIQKQLPYDRFFKVSKQIVKMLQEIKEEKDFTDVVEFDKIQYSNSGWTLVTIDPHNVEKKLLEKILFQIARKLDGLLREHLSNMSRLHAYSKGVFPYMIQQYDLLIKLDLLQILLQIFLS